MKSGIDLRLLTCEFFGFLLRISKKDRLNFLADIGICGRIGVCQEVLIVGGVELLRGLRKSGVIPLVQRTVLLIVLHPVVPGSGRDSDQDKHKDQRTDRETLFLLFFMLSFCCFVFYVFFILRGVLVVFFLFEFVLVFCFFLFAQLSPLSHFAGGFAFCLYAHVNRPLSFDSRKISYIIHALLRFEKPFSVLFRLKAEARCEQQPESRQLHRLEGRRYSAQYWPPHPVTQSGSCLGSSG